MAENKTSIQKEASKIALIYRVAGAKIRSLLNGIIPGIYDAKKAFEIQSEVSTVVRYLDIQATRWAQRAIPYFYYLSVDQAEKRLLKIKVLNFNKNIDEQKPSESITRLVKETVSYFLKANESIKANVGHFLMLMGSIDSDLKRLPVIEGKIQEMTFADDAMIRGIMNKAITSHKSIDWASRRMRDYIKGMLDGDDFIKIGDKFYQVSKYAEMLARSEMVQAHVQAVKDECQKWDNDLVQVSTHDNPCPICEEIENEIYSVSGSDTEYPPLDDIDFPPHPNCEHGLNPTSRVALRIEAAR